MRSKTHILAIIDCVNEGQATHHGRLLDVAAIASAMTSSPDITAVMTGTPDVATDAAAVNHSGCHSHDSSDGEGRHDELRDRVRTEGSMRTVGMDFSSVRGGGLACHRG